MMPITRAFIIFLRSRTVHLQSRFLPIESVSTCPPPATGTQASATRSSRPMFAPASARCSSATCSTSTWTASARASRTPAGCSSASPVSTNAYRAPPLWPAPLPIFGWMPRRATSTAAHKMQIQVTRAQVMRLFNRKVSTFSFLSSCIIICQI